MSLNFSPKGEKSRFTRLRQFYIRKIDKISKKFYANKVCQIATQLCEQSSHEILRISSIYKNSLNFYKLVKPNKYKDKYNSIDLY